eukprot:scaffold1954_cov268-Pinguiococcus_pyrenoidosus.AAC.210
MGIGGKGEKGKQQPKSWFSEAVAISSAPVAQPATCVLRCSVRRRRRPDPLVSSISNDEQHVEVHVEGRGGPDHAEPALLAGFGAPGEHRRRQQGHHAGRKHLRERPDVLRKGAEQQQGSQDVRLHHRQRAHQRLQEGYSTRAERDPGALLRMREPSAHGHSGPACARPGLRLGPRRLRGCGAGGRGRLRHRH